MVARNDNYQGDYRYRLKMCLNFLVKGLTAIGRERDVEIIVCDWGSEVPLHRELALHPAARGLVRFLVVPRELAVERQGQANFGYPIGFNAAVRRARGEFIFELTADILLMPAALHSLLSVLDGTFPEIPYREAFLPVLRRQLPMCQVRRQPSQREVEEYLQRNLALLPTDMMGCGYGFACVGVMHRDLWHASRGLNESMLYWGWVDIDQALRITQRYPIIELANFGVTGVHLEHFDKNNQMMASRKENPPMDTPAFEANDEQWGMRDEHLEFFAAERFSEEQPVDDSSRIGSVEAWSVTANDITQQLLNPNLSNHLNEVLEPIRNGFKQFWQYDPKCHNALVSLVWLASRRAVRVYVEAGMRVPIGACMVTRQSPGTEVYGIVAWEERHPAIQSFEFLANNLFKQLGRHGGYFRFIGGDPATGVERLSKSVAGRFAVDLALVQSGPTLPNAPRQAVELSRFLTPGGAIVVSGQDESSFQSVWLALKAECPHLTWIQYSDGVTGIALAAKLSG